MPGGYLNQLWEGSEQSPDRPRYLPLADSFSDSPSLSRTESQRLGPQFPVQLPHQDQYGHPEQLFQQPTPLIPLSAVEDLHPHEPYTSSTFQDPFNRAFISNQPVVHEGYIPAPGTRDEDLYPNLPDGYRDSLFQDYDDSSDESDFDRRLAEAEELREIEEQDDSEIDADYSEEDAEQDEGDPNEMEIDENYVEERSKPKARRGKPSARGTRGGRRGDLLAGDEEASVLLLELNYAEGNLDVQAGREDLVRLRIRGPSSDTCNEVRMKDSSLETIQRLSNSDKRPCSLTPRSSMLTILCLRFTQRWAKN